MNKVVRSAASYNDRLTGVLLLSSQAISKVVNSFVEIVLLLFHILDGFVAFT